MTYRVVLICDDCTAVGPQADSEATEMATARVRVAGAAAGWSFGADGHLCPYCRDRAVRPLHRTVSA